MATSKPAVALTVTAHQPDERLASLVRSQLPDLVRRYSAVTALCSRETHPTILRLLDQGGVLVEVDTGESAGILRIGEVRRTAVRLALRTDALHLQLCDFDRAIHWVANFPTELEAVIAEIPTYDLLVLGRTARAWNTHPPYQAETEPIFNHVFALVTGYKWDVGAGSRGLSRRAVEALLDSSQELTVGVDAEWPLLLLNRDGFRVGHRPCEGLEFETADRFGPEIEAQGGYGAWEAGMSADPDQWIFRLKVALMIAEAAVRHGPR